MITEDGLERMFALKSVLYVVLTQCLLQGTGSQVAPTSAYAQNDDAAQRLWSETLRLAGLPDA